MEILLHFIFKPIFLFKCFEIYTQKLVSPQIFIASISLKHNTNKKTHTHNAFQKGSIDILCMRVYLHPIFTVSMSDDKLLGMKITVQPVWFENVNAVISINLSKLLWDRYIYIYVLILHHKLPREMFSWHDHTVAFLAALLFFRHPTTSVQNTILPNKVQWSALFLLPGSSYLEPTPCFCPSFYLCQFI